MVRCLVKEFGVDANGADLGGITSLMHAQIKGHRPVVRALLKMNADPLLRLVVLELASHTALSLARKCGATPEQIEYLELRMHCANPNCAGRGLKTCNRCKRTRYCGVECQSAHWPTHKPECKKPAPKAASTRKVKSGGKL